MMKIFSLSSPIGIVRRREEKKKFDAEGKPRKFKMFFTQFSLSQTFLFSHFKKRFPHTCYLWNCWATLDREPITVCVTWVWITQEKGWSGCVVVAERSWKGRLFRVFFFTFTLQLQPKALKMKERRKEKSLLMPHHHDLFNGLRHSSLLLMVLSLCSACFQSLFPFTAAARFKQHPTIPFLTSLSWLISLKMRTTMFAIKDCEDGNAWTTLRRWAEEMEKLAGHRWWLFPMIAFFTPPEAIFRHFPPSRSFKMIIFPIFRARGTLKNWDVWLLMRVVDPSDFSQRILSFPPSWSDGGTNELMTAIYFPTILSLSDPYISISILIPKTLKAGRAREEMNF